MSKVVGLGTLADDITVSNGSANLSKMSLTPGSAPSNPVQGDMYVDNDDGYFKIYNGNAWKKIVLVSNFQLSGEQGTSGDYDNPDGSAGSLNSMNIQNYTDTNTGINYNFLVFTSSGYLTISGIGYVDVLLVAGGGGTKDTVAGGYQSGGAGAGGIAYVSQMKLTENTNLPILVGSGGTGHANGGDTTFNNLIALGGAYGNSYGQNGVNGGSGGGGGGGNPSGGTGGSGLQSTQNTNWLNGTLYQAGNDGGLGGGYNGTDTGSGGGGGAGGPGGNAAASTSSIAADAGDGGLGLTSIPGSLSESSITLLLNAANVGTVYNGVKYFAVGGVGGGYDESYLDGAVAPGGTAHNTNAAQNTGNGCGGINSPSGGPFGSSYTLNGGSGFAIIRWEA